MSAIGDIFGDGSIIRQILVWQVLGQLIAPVLAPVAQELTNTLQTRFPVVPLSPAEAADAVVRNHITHDEGLSAANKGGISREDFDTMVASTGEPISIQEALALYRRGLLPWDGGDAGGIGVLQAIRQSRVRDEWAPAVDALKTQPISPADAIDAAVSNQLPRDQAQQIAYQGGIDAAGFDILFHTRGRPPGPSEVTEMVRRGFVPATGTGPDATTLEQAIYESEIKDKWVPLYQHLIEYRPPPRTITALLRAGSITQDRALVLFRESGLTQELAQAYVDDATNQKLAADKTLAKSTVTELYDARVIDRATATSLLATLHYTAEESDWLLTLADLQRELRALNSAITKVGNLYMTRRIEKPAAVGALDALHVPADQRDQLLLTWQLERDATLRIPSESTIANALKYAVIDQATAQQELEALGYSPYDAWLVLSVQLKGPLPDQPPKDATHGVL